MPRTGQPTLGMSPTQFQQQQQSGEQVGWVDDGAPAGGFGAIYRYAYDETALYVAFIRQGAAQVAVAIQCRYPEAEQPRDGARGPQPPLRVEMQAAAQRFCVGHLPASAVHIEALRWTVWTEATGKDYADRLRAAPWPSAR